MKKVTCIWDMVTAGKIFIAGREYKVTHKEVENETYLKYLDSDGNYTCCGTIHSGSSRNFIVRRRSCGINWESRINYSAVEVK